MGRKREEKDNTKSSGYTEQGAGNGKRETVTSIIGMREIFLHQKIFFTYDQQLIAHE